MRNSVPEKKKRNNNERPRRKIKSNSFTLNIKMIPLMQPELAIANLLGRS